MFTYISYFQLSCSLEVTNQNDGIKTRVNLGKHNTLQFTIFALPFSF